jgi:hypothetical protein
MNMIEHLDHVINLVDRKAPSAGIKTALMTMREQLEGHAHDSDERAALATENAELKSRLAECRLKVQDLEAQLAHKQPGGTISDLGKSILQCLFDAGPGRPLAAEEVAEIVHCAPSAAEFHLQEFQKKGLCQQVRFRGDQRRIDGPEFGYWLTQEGRAFWMRGNLA